MEYHTNLGNNSCNPSIFKDQIIYRLLKQEEIGLSFQTVSNGCFIQ